MVETEIFSFLETIGITSSVLKFPDLVFFLIIPFIISAYAIYWFFQDLRIFSSYDTVNKFFAIVIPFLFLRLIYPIVFVISILYIVAIKRWPKSIWLRIVLLLLIFGLYTYVFPLISSLFNQ